MRETLFEELKFSKFWLRIFLLISFLFSINIYILSQTQERLLTVTTGSFPIFFFNTFDKINTTGIEYLSYTRLNIHFIDRDAGGVPTAANWKLSVQSATPDLGGTGGNSLPLDKIYLRVESVTVGSSDIALGAQNYFPLPSMSQDIVVNGINNVTNVEVVISYIVGNPNFMAGENPDYYMGFIEFRLQQQ